MKKTTTLFLHKEKIEKFYKVYIFIKTWKKLNFFSFIFFLLFSFLVGSKLQIQGYGFYFIRDPLLNVEHKKSIKATEIKLKQFSTHNVLI